MKIKLKRPIQNAAGDGELKEVTFKDEKDVCASDFYGVKYNADGSSDLGSMAPTVANLSGLTENQVALLDIKDYIVLSGKAASFLEE